MRNLIRYQGGSDNGRGGGLVLERGPRTRTLPKVVKEIVSLNNHTFPL